MKIRIDKEYAITRDHQHIETSMDLQELTEYSNVMSITDVHVDFHVVHTKPIQYHVSGTVKTTVGLVCSNCLQDLQVHVNSNLEETFVLTEAEVDSEMYEESDEELHYIVGQEIDLKPFIKQEILLSFPMKSLCQEVCKGLCPNCGINRNLESCACETQRMDPRFADLADFFNK